MVALILTLLLGVPVCNTVDSTQPICVWNAQTQGHGEGRSVLLIGNDVIRLD
jgi:hypothetical protein